MLPPEVLRIVLLIGMAATAYLMILAWDKDYGEQAQPEAVAQAPVVDGQVAQSPPQAVTGEFAQLPSAPPAATGGSSEFPSDVAPAPDAAAGGSEASTNAQLPQDPVPRAPSDRLIKVTTDTLVVWIDRLGGDVVGSRLVQYPVRLGSDVPYTLLDSGSQTYVAQSGLFGVDTSGSSRPFYTSRQSEYELTGDELNVELTHEKDGVQVTKTYTFRPDAYVIDVGYQVANATSEPYETGIFVQLKRDGSPPRGGSTGMMFAPQPYLGAALTTTESRYEKVGFDDLDEGEYREVVEGGWIAILQHYFLSAWVADPLANNSYFGRKRADGLYSVGYRGPNVRVEPGGAPVDLSARLYMGPKDQKRLEQIAPNLNLTVDYGILWWLAVPLFYLLDFLHGFVSNWGVAIILLTFVVKLIFYPLSAASYRSMANLRRVAPAMKKLQERYADDRQKLSTEMMALYKKEKVNPAGGCFPMLLQMPVFIALYWVLYESVELRQAPFFLWIEDLAVKDPFYVLPILMGVSMFGQQLLNPPPPDPMQAKIMKMMPIMFTVLFLFFPAGLVLYWLVNNVLSIAQQWYITNQIENAAAAGKPT